MSATISFPVLRPEQLSDPAFDVLLQMSNCRHPDEGPCWSFLTRLDYLQSWLDDDATDTRRGHQPHAARAEIEVIVLSIVTMGAAAVFVVKDRCFANAVKE